MLTLGFLPPLEGAFFKHFGQNFEIEHAHQLGGRPGILRLMAFRNAAIMGGYDDDALNYAAANRGVHDTANTLQERQKYGASFSQEQTITPTLELFSRAMRQGRLGYLWLCRSASLACAGLSLNGALWGRERDTLGVSLIHNEISDVYKRDLEAECVCTGKVEPRDGGLLVT